jgi:hypothetical protein
MDPDLAELGLPPLESSSSIRCAVRRGLQEGMEDALVVAFSGTYGYGSAGNGDAAFMCEAVEAAVAAWTPRAIILDFSELDYEWGDMLESVLPGDEGEFGPPCVTAALVVGDGCREGLRTLLFGVNAPHRLSELSWVHENLPRAWEHVRSKLEAAQQPDAADERHDG